MNSEYKIKEYQYYKRLANFISEVLSLLEMKMKNKN